MTKELRATHLIFVRHGKSISNLESAIIELARDTAAVKLYGLADIRRALLASGLSVTKRDLHEKPEPIEEWLASAASPDLARQKVRLMLEASLKADAAGLRAQRNRSGSITSRQSRARVLASVAQGAIH